MLDSSSPTQSFVKLGSVKCLLQVLNMVFAYPTQHPGSSSGYAMYVGVYTTLAIKKVIPCPIVRGSKASILASQELSSQKSESLSGRTT